MTSTKQAAWQASRPSSSNISVPISTIVQRGAATDISVTIDPRRPAVPAAAIGPDPGQRMPSPAPAIASPTAPSGPARSMPR